VIENGEIEALRGSSISGGSRRAKLAPRQQRVQTLASSIRRAKPSGANSSNERDEGRRKSVAYWRRSNTMEDAHTKSVEETLSFFGTDEEAGLSEEQVQSAQDKYGPNGKPPWQ